MKFILGLLSIVNMVVKSDEFNEMKISELKKFFEDRGQKCLGCMTKEDYIEEARNIKDLPVIEKKEEVSDMIGAVQQLQKIMSTNEIMGIGRRLGAYLKEAEVSKEDALKKLCEDYPGFGEVNVDKIEKMISALPTFLLNPPSMPSNKKEEEEEKDL
eukprot:GHVP01026385.1.p1 GENE.GHVP01026385.1~~GHVP01026385.1.p1  ORF type:complete len:157 (+),score=41.72 GHVP01026385.1:502-972(+)